MNSELKTYPEQASYVKGKKIWLELGNDQTIVVSAQARDVIQFASLDEELFISKLKELFSDCLTNLPFPFHLITVSKASDSWDPYNPYLRVDIKDRWREAFQESEGTVSTGEAEEAV